MFRKIVAGSVGIASLWFLASAYAQQPAASFFTGADPRAIKFQPIDVGRANRAPNMSNMFRPARQPQTFTLSNFFHKATLGTWPPTVPNTPILKESPYQKIILPKKK